MCGDMDLSVRWLIENHDIVVLTAQILVNALQSGEVPSLELLSLILLDECHNTTGKHPYNNIMTRYLDTKLTSSAHSLPQVPRLRLLLLYRQSIAVCSILFHLFYYNIYNPACLRLWA